MRTALEGDGTGLLRAVAHAHAGNESRSPDCAYPRRISGPGTGTPGKMGPTRPGRTTKAFAKRSRHSCAYGSDQWGFDKRNANSQRYAAEHHQQLESATGQRPERVKREL